MSDKVLEKIKDALGDVVDDMDEDDLKGAINDNIDLGEIIGDLIKEDEEVQDALKAKVKELLLKDIEDNISDSDDLDNYLENNSWSDLTDGIFDITEIVKELAADDDKIQKELKKKVRELLESHVEDLSDDDLPENIWDKDMVVSRTKAIMEDPNFVKEFTEVFDRSLKKIMVGMTKSGDRNFEKTVREHPQVQAVMQNRIDDMMGDSTFLDDLRKALIIKVSETPDLQKALLNMMFGKMAEHLVEVMFKRI